MGEIYEFADHRNKTESLFETEISNQEMLLKDSVWFHGKIERSEAETRILNNGEFLVRLSHAEESKFVISTKWNGKFLHTIVKTTPPSDKTGILYFIDPRFKYPSVLELIKFHKENQYPLSENSEAVLYKPIDMNQIRNNGFSSLRESKFRKSMNPFRRHQHDKKSRLPRSDSESHLVSSSLSQSNEQFQDPLSLSRHSLTELHRASEPEPGVPHKPRKPSRHLLLKLRPSNLRIRNKKLYKESGDYADYNQVRDTDNGLLREQQRRGLSGSLNSSNRSPSLFGLNTRSSDNVATTPVPKKTISSMLKGRMQKKTSVDESVYVLAQSSNCDSSNRIDCDGADDDDNRDSTLTLRPRSNTVSNDEEGKFDVYGFDRVNSADFVKSPMYTVVTATRQLGLSGFLDLGLSGHRVTCLSLVNGPLDKTAINIAASRLLSDRDTDGPRLLARHLVEELTRAFHIAMSNIEWPPTAIGYRWAFLTGSSSFQRDLSIRQTALSHFIMATVVCTTSTEKRINLIFFWIKCAQYLLNHVQDMFHFMAIFSAIFSQQILSLRVWKLVYRQDPSAKLMMESLKEAIKKGCLFRTDIDCCIPDLVQLCNVFNGNEDDLNLVSRVCFDVATWSDQAFTNSSSWLMRIMKELNAVSAVPFYREVVQTESLLCLILGKNSISYSDMTPLIGKIDECITIMATLINENHV